jgi:hypothetical protein
MEYSNEILIASILYIGLMNWVYWREYKPRRRKGVIRRGSEWDNDWHPDSHL